MHNKAKEKFASNDRPFSVAQPASVFNVNAISGSHRLVEWSLGPQGNRPVRQISATPTVHGGRLGNWVQQEPKACGCYWRRGRCFPYTLYAIHEFRDQPIRRAILETPFGSSRIGHIQCRLWLWFVIDCWYQPLLFALVSYTLFG